MMGRPQLAAALLLFAPTLVSTAEGAATVPLELVHGPLGEAASRQTLFLATSSSGKELYLFDSASGELRTFLETGEAWGDPVLLKDPTSGAVSGKALRMDVRDGVVVVASAQRVYRFAIDGTFLGSDGGFLLPSDIVSLSATELVLGLRNMPTPGGGFLLQEGLKGFESPPRLAVLDEDFEVRGGGLPVGDEEWTSNRAAARSLKLAWNGRRLYAAEGSNYTIYELDRGLHVRDVLRDPELQFEDGLPVNDGEEPAQARKVPDEVGRLEARSGRSLVTRAPASSSARGGGMFSNVAVIRDIAWDKRSGRLILLLSSRAAGGRDAIDLLDPLTGEIRRILLRRPAGADAEAALSQIAVGHRYLWLRSHAGRSLTYRLDRHHLEGGQRLVIPERQSRPDEKKREGASRER